MKNLEITIRDEYLGDSKIKSKPMSNLNYKLDIDHNNYNKMWIGSHSVDFGINLSHEYNSIMGDTSILLIDKNKYEFEFEFNEGKLTNVKTSYELNPIELVKLKIKFALSYSLNIAKKIAQNEKFNSDFRKNLYRIQNYKVEEHYYSVNVSGSNFRNRHSIKIHPTIYE